MLKNDPKFKVNYSVGLKWPVVNIYNVSKRELR